VPLINLDGMGKNREVAIEGKKDEILTSASSAVHRERWKKATNRSPR